MRFLATCLIAATLVHSSSAQASLELLEHPYASTIVSLDPSGSSLVFQAQYASRLYRWRRGVGVTPMDTPTGPLGTFMSGFGSDQGGGLITGFLGALGVVWREGQSPVALGTLGSTSHYFTAKATNADASIVFGQMEDGYADSRAVAWLAGEAYPLGGAFRALSANSEVAVGSDHTPVFAWPPRRPVAWRTTPPFQRTRLQLPFSHDSGEAFGVNADGSVIVGYSHVVYPHSHPRQARIWHSGVPMSLPVPGSDSAAYAVDAAGTTVIGDTYLSGAPNAQTAFIHREGVGAMMVVDALAQSGVSVPPSIWLTSARHISPDGLSMAGRGLDLSDPMLATGFTWIASFLEVGSKTCGPVGVHSGGLPASLSASGSASIAANDLVLQARLLPADSWGMFLMSSAVTAATTQAGVGGSLCLSGPVTVFDRPGEIRSADAAGAIDLPVDWSSLPGQGAATAGQTHAFQVWYRDTKGPNASLFSDALVVTTMQ